VPTDAPTNRPADPPTDEPVAAPTGAATAAVPAARLAGALLRFRVLAYVVGVMLLALVVAMGFKYLGDQPRGVEIIGPIHGFVYAVYLALALDLAIKARWSIRGTVVVLIAGTIPFLSFVAERTVTRKVQANQRL
jgi:integral membrane protein